MLKRPYVSTCARWRKDLLRSGPAIRAPITVEKKSSSGGTSATTFRDGMGDLPLSPPQDPAKICPTNRKWELDSLSLSLALVLESYCGSFSFRKIWNNTWATGNWPVGPRKIEPRFNSPRHLIVSRGIVGCWCHPYKWAFSSGPLEIGHVSPEFRLRLKQNRKCPVSAHMYLEPHLTAAFVV